jgi:hypothetical protein
MVKMNIDLQSLTFNDAHEIVANWVARHGNYMKVSFRDEVALRETLVDWSQSNRRETERFTSYLKERFPDFAKYVNA